jgi:hypothetical protein
MTNFRNREHCDYYEHCSIAAALQCSSIAAALQQYCSSIAAARQQRLQQ